MKIKSILFTLTMLMSFSDIAAAEKSYTYTLDVGGDSEISPFMVSYNRVEGIFLGAGVPKEFRDYYGMESRLTFYGFYGYGLSNDQSRYRGGLTRKFFGRNGIEFGVEAFDLTQSDDQWIIPKDENSIAAFFFHQDFHDFYRNRGSSVYAIKNFGYNFNIEGGYRQEEHENMSVEKDWSLFRNGRQFRDNPLVDEGIYNNTYLTLTLGNPKWNRGTSLRIEAEWNSSLFEDEMPNYERYIATFSRKQQLSRDDALNFRVRYGTSNGAVPIQKKFDLGGIGTMRGYRFKEFRNGDKMALVNFEYTTRGDVISGLEFMPILDDFNISFFADAGVIWNRADDLPNTSDFNRSVGIGISSEDDGFRIDFAKPLDGPENERDVIVSFRINRMF